MLKAASRPCQAGISLVELMVGMTISLVLLTAALSAFLNLSTAAVSALQAARLNQQLRAAMELMTKELQRSGYINWRATWELTDANGDGKVDIRDFYLVVTPLMREMGSITIDANGSCILYSYDIDRDGGKSTNDFENFGFRLNDGAIQIKTAGAHACDSSGWQALTDATVTVTELLFELDSYQNSTSSAAMYSVSDDGIPSGSCQPSSISADTLPDIGILPDREAILCVEHRGIRVAVAAQLTSDPTVATGLENFVKLRNDRFNPFQPES
ncbi:MAG: prepilin-type N-terminal cleavage/methylation domain-containing protein [Porticoccaceae bacterium]|nr:prepilin-type N-terminal cleavage/methylation domain-containing protein [Porticoccaceae bacterium]